MSQKKCFFTVPYHGEIAKFSNYEDAMRFAQAVSAGGDEIEVRHPKGAVGKYRGGEPLPEYAGHHSELFKTFEN